MKRLLFVVLLVAWVKSEAHAFDRENPPEVSVAEGRLQGTWADEGVRIFKGVPYARPPVGELRWRAPQALAPWTGVYRAVEFGARAVQRWMWRDMIFRSTAMSEDCLYLNVWTPPPTPNALAPVLVYFHGGAFVAGDGSEPRYDGASMARKGIVTVTVNYRLGVFGFLAHPELSRESPHGASGNYGLLDQNAALQWVRRNIAAFGGDPERVTLAGQSAGAAAVNAHMASPLSRGLFAGAIGQSGAMLGTRSVLPLDRAEANGVALAGALQCADLAALRAVPAETLLAITAEPRLGHYPPTLDGYFFVVRPQEIFATGRQADVPLLAGWTSAEVGYEALLGEAEPTRHNFERAVRELYGVRADEVLAVYRAETDEAVPAVASDLASDRFNAYNTWKWVDLHSKSGGSPVFRYLYSQPLPPAEGEGTRSPPAQRGAPHSADIAYAMGNLALLPGQNWSRDDEKTSVAMQGYFVNFIRTGNPNGDGLPAWPWIQASLPKIMVFEAGAHLAPEPGLKRYHLLDTF